MEQAWCAAAREYCHATGRCLCLVQRTRAWEINWHLDQLIAALERL